MCTAFWASAFWTVTKKMKKGSKKDRKKKNIKGDGKSNFVKRFFCNFNFKTGARAVALMSASIAVYYMSKYFESLLQHDVHLDKKDEQCFIEFVDDAVAFLMWIVALILSLLMFIGVWKGKTILIKIWLIAMLFHTLYEIAGLLSIFAALMFQFPSDIISEISRIVVEVYFLLVVYIYYDKEIKASIENTEEKKKDVFTIDV